MVLSFLGNGAGFSKEHTSAYFDTDKREMVIIDLSLLNEKKLEEMDLSYYDKFFILITHTHSDHISGLGLWIQWVQFVLKKEVTIIAPSEKVKENIIYLLTELDGCDSSWYTVLTANEVSEPWFGSAIPTAHSPQLEGKCFGYRLNIGGKNVIYTGDTSTLAPFKPFLTQNCELYVDVSINYGMIHLKLEDALPELVEFAEKGVQVYLMHLDNIEKAVHIIFRTKNIYLAVSDS